MSKKQNIKVGDKVRLKKEFVGEDGKAKTVSCKKWDCPLLAGDPVEMKIQQVFSSALFGGGCAVPWQAYELVEAAPKKQKKLSGAAKTAHEKKLAREGKVRVEAGEALSAGDLVTIASDGKGYKSEPIPPCFPNAPRPEAKVGEKFVLVNIGASLCSYRIGTICQLLSNDSSVMPLFRFTASDTPLFVYWNQLRPLTASEAAAEAEKDAKKAQVAPEAVKTTIGPEKGPETGILYTISLHTKQPTGAHRLVKIGSEVDLQREMMTRETGKREWEDVPAEVAPEPVSSTLGSCYDSHPHDPVPAKESFKLVELITTAGGEIAVVIEIDGEKIGAKAKRGLILKTFPQLKDII